MEGQACIWQVRRGDDVTGRAVPVVRQTVAICISAQVCQIAPGQDIRLQGSVLSRGNAMCEPCRHKGKGHYGQEYRVSEVHKRFLHHIAFIAQLMRKFNSGSLSRGFAGTGLPTP